MEEFDLDLNTMGGTSISNLKKSQQNDIDSDIDYNKILEDTYSDSKTTSANNSMYETREKQVRAMEVKNDSKKKKKNVNMNSFIRNLETNLDNMSKSHVIDNEDNTSAPQSIEFRTVNEDKTLYEQFCEFKHMDIVIVILIFMLLNNKLTIETLYKIPYIEMNPYWNLFIRTVIFSVMLYLVKKYYRIKI
jgi:hypothetical protein